MLESLWSNVVAVISPSSNNTKESDMTPDEASDAKGDANPPGGQEPPAPPSPPAGQPPAPPAPPDQGAQPIAEDNDTTGSPMDAESPSNSTLFPPAPPEPSGSTAEPMTGVATSPPATSGPMLDATEPARVSWGNDDFQAIPGGIITASDLLGVKGSDADVEDLAEAPVGLMSPNFNPRHLLRPLMAQNILSPYPSKPPEPDPLPDDLRVKVYMLNLSGEWDDQGTGFIKTRRDFTGKTDAEKLGNPDGNDSPPGVEPPTPPSPPRSPGEAGDPPAADSATATAPAFTDDSPSSPTATPDPPAAPSTPPSTSTDPPAEEKDSPEIGPPEKPRMMIWVQSEHSEAILVPEQDCATLHYEMQGGTIVTWAMQRKRKPGDPAGMPDFDEEETEEVAISFQDEDTFKSFMSWLEFYSEAADDGYDELVLPTPTTSNIIEFVSLWPDVISTRKEDVVKRITDNKFFPALVQTFKDLEDFDQFEELRTIHALVKNFIAADSTICQYLASMQNVADTIALLEYAPLRRNKGEKADRHRKFIAKQRLSLPEEFKLPNCEDLEKLIVYQFRLQYLKEEVVYGQLPVMNLAALTNMIHQNNQVIFNLLIRDRDFLDDLIQRMKSFDLTKAEPESPESKQIATCFDFLCELIYRVRGTPNVQIRAQLVARLEGLGVYNALASIVADSKVLPSEYEHTWLCVVEIMNCFFTRTLAVHMLFNQTNHPVEGFRQYLASWIHYRREKMEAGDMDIVPNLLSRIVDVLCADMNCKKGLLLQVAYLVFQLLGCNDLPGDLGSSNVACADIVDFFVREEIPKLQELINRRWSPQTKQHPRTLFHQQQLAVEVLQRIHSHHPDKFTRILNQTNILESVVHLIQLPNGTAPPPPADFAPHMVTTQTPQELFASRSNLLQPDKPAVDTTATDEELTPAPKPGDRPPSAPTSPNNAPAPPPAQTWPPQHEPLELAPGAADRPPKRTAASLACIRLIRSLCFGHDPNIAELIASQSYLKPVLDLLIANGTRDTLLRSSIRALLDQLNASGSEPLLRCVVSWDLDQQPVCKDTFERFKAKVKNLDSAASLMHAPPTPALNQPPIPSSTLPVHSAWQQSGRSEEDWFFEEDGETKVDGPAPGSGGELGSNEGGPMGGRKFMAPKRKQDVDDTNLLIHKAGEAPEGAPANGAAGTPPGTAPAKKPGIVSFSFKPKKRKRGGALFSANKRKRAT